MRLFRKKNALATLNDKRGSIWRDPEDDNIKGVMWHKGEEIYLKGRKENIGGHWVIKFEITSREASKIRGVT